LPVLKLMPASPPAMRGSFGTPGIAIPACPKGSCTACDFALSYPNRSSFSMAAPSVWFQPEANVYVFMFCRPNADVLVPSAMPPKLPGMNRSRFE